MPLHMPRLSTARTPSAVSIICYCTCPDCPLHVRLVQCQSYATAHAQTKALSTAHLVHAVSTICYCTTATICYYHATVHSMPSSVSTSTVQGHNYTSEYKSISQFQPDAAMTHIMPLNTCQSKPASYMIVTLCSLAGPGWLPHGGFQRWACPLLLRVHRKLPWTSPGE